MTNPGAETTTLWMIKNVIFSSDKISTDVLFLSASNMRALTFSFFVAYKDHLIMTITRAAAVVPYTHEPRTYRAKVEHVVELPHPAVVDQQIQDPLLVGVHGTNSFYRLRRQ